MGSLGTCFGCSRIEIDGVQYVVTNDIRKQVSDIISQDQQTSVDKAKKYIDRKGLQFCNMRYDASFKHVYSVDNYKHSLNFAHDVAIFTGHTALSRRIAIVQKHDFERTSLETILSARTTQEKELNQGSNEVHIRKPDVMCAVNHGVRVHVEMQQKNNGDIERRTKEYENLADQYFGIVPTVGLSVNAYVNPNWAGVEWSNFEQYRTGLNKLRSKLNTVALKRMVNVSAFSEQLNQLIIDIKCLIELISSSDMGAICPQDVKEIELWVGRFVDLLFGKQAKLDEVTIGKKKRVVRGVSLCSQLRLMEKDLKNCYTIKKSDDLLKVNYINLDGIEQLNVAIYLGNIDKSSLGGPNENRGHDAKIRGIQARWDTEIAKRVAGKRGKERRAITEAGKRLCQRNIALQYLQYFSDRDFEKYITDDTVKEECSYMSVTNDHEENLTRPDILEQLRSLYDFDEQVRLAKNEGEIDGKISEIIKLAANDQLSNVLSDLSDEYPYHRGIIVRSLENRVAQVTDRRRRTIISSAISKLKSNRRIDCSTPSSPVKSPGPKQKPRTRTRRG